MHYNELLPRRRFSILFAKEFVTFWCHFSSSVTSGLKKRDEVTTPPLGHLTGV